MHGWPNGLGIGPQNQQCRFESCTVLHFYQVTQQKMNHKAFELLSTEELQCMKKNELIDYLRDISKEVLRLQYVEEREKKSIKVSYKMQEGFSDDPFQDLLVVTTATIEASGKTYDKQHATPKRHMDKAEDTSDLQRHIAKQTLREVFDDYVKDRFRL